VVEDARKEDANDRIIVGKEERIECIADELAAGHSKTEVDVDEAWTRRRKTVTAFVADKDHHIAFQFAGIQHSKAISRAVRPEHTEPKRNHIQFLSSEGAHLSASSVERGIRIANA
jgi:hypothetical protein